MENNTLLWSTEENGILTLGVSSQFQEEAGDMSYVNIAELGQIEVDETLLNVEASKAAIEVPSPVSGEIVARNDKAETTPSILNSDKQSDNWLVKIKIG